MCQKFACAHVAPLLPRRGPRVLYQALNDNDTHLNTPQQGQGRLSVLTMTVFSPWRVKLLMLILIWTISVQGVTVTIPLTAPASAPLLSRSLVSFSLEQDRWGDWVGQGAGNPFFSNTLNNLKQLTGEPASIRIGADSEDRTNFNPSVQVRHCFSPRCRKYFLTRPHSFQKANFPLSQRYCHIPRPQKMSSERISIALLHCFHQVRWQ
jgi:hypothetical protein